MTILSRGVDDISAIVEFSAALLSLRVRGGVYEHEIIADAAGGGAAAAFPGSGEELIAPRKIESYYRRSEPACRTAPLSFKPGRWPVGPGRALTRELLEFRAADGAEVPQRIEMVGLKRRADLIH